MTLPTAKLKVTHGTFVVGKDTEYVIDASRTPITYSKTREKFTFSCEVIVTGATDSAFATACTNLEAAYDASNANKLFKIEFDSETHETYNPASSTNTGFNTRPSITKPGSDTDSGRSRRYVIGVEIDLPYTESGKNGRRDGKWQLFKAPSGRGRLVFSGVYTAVGSSSAYEKYSGSADTWCATITDAIGGTWEGPVEEQIDGDDEHGAGAAASGSVGKILRFSRVYEELIYAQSGAGTNDANLKRVLLTVDHAVEAPGDYVPGGQGAFRLHRLAVRYSCHVVKSQTQDLVSLYENTIKPFMLEEARKAAGARSLALVSHTPDLDRTDNRISAQMVVLAAGNGRFVSSRVITEDTEDPGNKTRGVWDGRKKSKHRFSYPGSLFRTVTHEYEVLGGPAGAARGAGGGGGGGDQFGIFGNRPLEFQFVEGSDEEAALDSFFGLDVGGPGGGGDAEDASFAVAGGVAEPKDLVRVPVGPIYARYEPVVYGTERQFTTTKITKRRTWEYIREPEEGTGATTTGGEPTPPRSISPGGGLR